MATAKTQVGASKNGVSPALQGRSIDFIPNGDFDDTLESDFDDIEFELYAVEEQAPGSLDPNRVEASLLAPLQESRLLTFDGEQLLFKQLNFLRFRASAIQAGLHPKRPSARKLKEIDRLLSEVEKVREELARANLRLVVSVAGKLSISRDEFDEFDEFVAEGNGILLYAIDKFDYSRGYRFSTYLTHAVQRHLYRVIDRRRKRAQREHPCQAEMMAQEPMIETDPSESIEDEIKVAAAAVISKFDETLDERERVIVRGRFGLDGSGESLTFRELGEQLGLSKERVRQLLQRSLEKLGEVAKPFESIFASH
ncbi:MAG: sigma-70 family RNA polymerase sigma factor [Planctomycetales bacterium]